MLAAISTSFSHTCLLTTSGGVKCWGDNQLGELGDGTTNNSLLPVDVAGLGSGVSAIAGGDWFSCALTSAGGVECWGLNTVGQLGNGTQTNSSTPVQVHGLETGVQAISARGAHACALMMTGNVRCWGQGQPGGVYSTLPAAVPTPSAVTAVSVGGRTSCALTASGGVECWANVADSPSYVPGLTSGVSAISGGGYHACALMKDGRLECWGRNVEGQLGDGTTTSSTSPVTVVGLTGVSAISEGDLFSCALTSAGGIKCWGGNAVGQLGNGTQGGIDPTPADVSGLTSGVSAISAGVDETCVVTISGGGSCWGANRSGQLGDGTTTTQTVPVALFGPMISGIHSSLAKIDASGNVLVTTAWAGIDPYAKITSFQAQFRTGTGPWHDVPLVHPLATHFTIAMNRSKALYTIQIRAFDAFGHAGSWSPLSFTPNTAQETSAAFSTGWDFRPGPGFWGGATERLHRVGAEAMFTFHGGGVDWIGGVGPTYGSADIYIDGVYMTTVDCYAAAPAHRHVLFRDELLGRSAHTIEIFGRGRIDVDGFVWFTPPYPR